MNIILFDDKKTRASLLPFTFTRPIADIRCGIFTISEKWKMYLPNANISYLCFENYLSRKYSTKYQNENIYVNGATLPNEALILAISSLSENQCIVHDNVLIALKSNATLTVDELFEFNKFDNADSRLDIKLISKRWDIFQLNGSEIRSDFEFIKKSKTNVGVNDIHTKCYNQENIFVEEGAKIFASTLNASFGPIYIGKNCEIQEGTVIRGAFAMCEGASTNMCTKLRGDVTLGPYSKVGGEVSNSVIFGYSNKAHDGFLGNSVIGEWCNLGADSNTSNLKNNYSNVTVYDYQSNDYEDTGLMFCGMMMGDHSKCGINTMFNTGSVVGVFANIFGGNFPPKHIPSFSWGGSDGMKVYEFEKAMQVAHIAYKRRNQEFTEMDKEILKAIFEMKS